MAKWVGYNISKVYNDDEELLRMFKKALPMSFFSCDAENPPETIATETTAKVTRDGTAIIPYAYGGWSASACAKFAYSGVAAILIPAGKKRRGKVRYSIRVWYGMWTMYWQIKYHPKARPEFWQVVAIPYRQKTKGGPVANGPNWLQ